MAIPITSDLTTPSSGRQPNRRHNVVTSERERRHMSSQLMHLFIVQLWRFLNRENSQDNHGDDDHDDEADDDQEDVIQSLENISKILLNRRRMSLPASFPDLVPRESQSGPSNNR